MEFNDFYHIQEEEEDIKKLTNDPEIDPFRVLIYDKDYILLLDYKSPTFHGKALDFISILKALEIDSNVDAEKSDFTNIQIVFSLKIMNFLIDIATSHGIFCISVSIDDINRPAMKANPLNAICTLYSIISLNTTNSLNLNCIKFSDKLITVLYDIFSKLCNPKFAEYISFVSPNNEVFCSFGKTEIPHDDYYEVWDEAMSIAADLENSDQHALSDNTDYLAVFSFLPFVKVVAIFSEEALEFPEPEDKKEKIQANNEFLMNPFISKLNELKQLIPAIYKNDQFFTADENDSD